jgi:RNA polymerase sigma-70 factor (ECF subfamily)
MELEGNGHSRLASPGRTKSGASSNLRGQSLSELGFKDEQDILDKLRDKDPNALAGLFFLYQTKVYHVVLGIVNNEGAAEEIVQETFWRIWDQAHQIDKDVVTLGPWVKAIARHRALDRLRLSTVRMAVHASSMEEYSLAVPQSTAENLFLTRELAETVREACNRLTENQRQVVELAYYQGLSQTEIAVVLKKPLGTVKSWTRSALRSLRRSLLKKQRSAERP